ncbi:MFS transporter [Burkholderia sp. ABCPW 14]|uniref:MFS transporter n=1 Tax=Burkholderia sp. ABCPW 14 TaxID=1637860 RepID=UPI000770C8CB|nr:MFS transporter [Burkholderia sp. ABCPW 14]KVD90452.1 MFS transporter [Burkholderia sp. ABCPW 14]
MTDSAQDSIDEATRAARVSWFATLRGPFAYRAFASIWVASLVGNIGGSIQTVGASWLMTSMAPSPTMVSLVQTAFTLPIALFALMSGVAADAWDRRTVMLLSQSMMFAVALCLVVLMAAGAMTPARLLVCMFVGGCAGAMFQPAWQSAVTEQVPARELSAAIALDSFSMNFARTAGPALGGFIVAAVSPDAAFVLSGLSYAGLIYVLSRSIRGAAARKPARARLATLLVQGVRYCFRTPGIRGTLIRSSVFGFLGSPVWALLPLFAKTQFGGEARTYGVLLASFGAGAASGALGGAALRVRLGREALIRLCTLTFAAGMLMTAWSPCQAAAMLGLAVAGGSWVAVVSTYNLTIQTASPAWVAGRSLSLFHSFIVGGLSIGSYLWGIAATGSSINSAFAVSALMMVASICLASWFPLPTREMIGEDAHGEPQRT